MLFLMGSDRYGAQAAYLPSVISSWVSSRGLVLKYKITFGKSTRCIWQQWTPTETLWEMAKTQLMSQSPSACLHSSVPEWFVIEPVCSQLTVLCGIQHEFSSLRGVAVNKHNPNRSNWVVTTACITWKENTNPMHKETSPTVWLSYEGRAAPSEHNAI